ncbi:MAG: MarR family transcriptional regulator [Desulfobacteraceae bacterium]|nr:MarR family transcriptional regulator [Desulfobacteraceae bacterium]
MYESFAEKAVGKRIHILFRLSMMNLRDKMKKIGFGAGDYAFLAILFMEEGLSQDELSRRMRVDKSSTARTIAKLEKIGMVERRPDPEEYRIKRVFLGEKALENKSDFFNIVKNWHAVLEKDIEEDHLKIILAGMDKMIANAEVCLGLEEINK